MPVTRTTLLRPASRAAPPATMAQQPAAPGRAALAQPGATAGLDNAARLGHRFAQTGVYPSAQAEAPAAASAGSAGSVVQLVKGLGQQQKTAQKKKALLSPPGGIKKPPKKKDPGSNIKPGTLKRTKTGLTYTTVAGAKHSETYNPKTRTQTTTTTGLKRTAVGLRNPAHRNPQGFRVHNRYGLSTGQSSRNQNVVSHNSPSWAGMQAGGKFSNSSMTSPGYNSAIEKQEKVWRTLVGNQKFDYKTVTEYEDIDPAADARHIAAMLSHPNWDEERVRNRLEQVKARYPDAKRIKNETRTITLPSGQTFSFPQGRDLLAYIPARAHDVKAADKYRDARGDDSEGSDYELDEEDLLAAPAPAKKSAKKLVKKPAKKLVKKPAKRPRDDDSDDAEDDEDEMPRKRSNKGIH